MMDGTVDSKMYNKYSEVWVLCVSWRIYEVVHAIISQNLYIFINV